MKFNQEILRRYMAVAPLPLAFERTLECRIYQKLPFVRPILDVGCGEGLFAKILFAEPIDTGIDPNSRELDRARELGAYEELIECFGDAIPKADGSYNTVFSNSVLEHIPDLEPVLREVHRLLAPEGHFYFTVPSSSFDRYNAGSQLLEGLGLRGLAGRFRGFYNNFWNHYHYYALDGWKELAVRTGFEVVDAYTYDPKRVCLLNDLLVPLSLPALVTKKATNRWTFASGLRRILLAPVAAAAERILDGAERAENGGLVFMSLRKPASS